MRSSTDVPRSSEERSAIGGRLSPGGLLAPEPRAYANAHGQNRQVTRLGEVLELLHGAGERARPARLTVLEWTHRSRSAAAFDRFMAEHHARHAGAPVTHIASAESAPAAPQETSRTTRLALESPTRYREESAGVQAGKRYQVRDGERWVVWDADWGAVTHETAPEGGPPSTSYALLLDPVGLVGAYRLEG